MDLGDRPAHLERVADDREESFLGERELEDVVGAGVDARRDLVERVAIGGVRQHDDRHVLVGRIGPDAPAGVHDIARRGPETDQDGLRLAHDDGRDRSIAMTDRADVVAGFVQRRRQRRMAPRFILDDEDQSTGGFLGEHVLVRCS